MNRQIVSRLCSYLGAAEAGTIGAAIESLFGRLWECVEQNPEDHWTRPWEFDIKVEVVSQSRDLLCLRLFRP